MYQNRKPTLSPKIIVDDVELKKILIEIGIAKNENIKQTVTRLVKKEFENIKEGKQ